MTYTKWLNLSGGMLLTLGVLIAFISNRYTGRGMGEARKGVGVWAPAKDSPEWKEKEHRLWWADFWFCSGLVLTFIGGILQTLGSILPLEHGGSGSGAVGLLVTRGAESWQFFAFYLWSTSGLGIRTGR